MTPRSWKAYHYYWRCLVDVRGILPQDEIVVGNNALIHRVRDDIQRTYARLIPVVRGLLRLK